MMICLYYKSGPMNWAFDHGARFCVMRSIFMRHFSNPISSPVLSGGRCRFDAKDTFAPPTRLRAVSAPRNSISEP